MSTSEVKPQYWRVNTTEDYDYFQASRMSLDEEGNLWVQQALDSSNPLMGHEMLGVYAKGVWLSFRQITQEHYDEVKQHGCV